MAQPQRYPRRLIEVDLPIRTISEYARSEKNLRSGHPWHLHIWWARRPWGACRAVALASLLPDPTDERCSDEFVRAAEAALSNLGVRTDGARATLRDALLRFIGDFARWEAGDTSYMREAARALVAASHPTTPSVLDSFAGYGAIPGEAARLGCESIAADLNPVALLCLRTLLEGVPKHGHALLDQFRDGAAFLRKEAEKRLGAYYPKRKGKQPIAWLWARTATCEGPACGATIPLISQTTIAKGKRKAWIAVSGDPDSREVRIEIGSGKTIPAGLVKTAGGGHAVCPVCGYTTNKERVKAQGKEGRLGHRLFGVALAIGQRQGKEYDNASAEDVAAAERAARGWEDACASGAATELSERYPYHDPRAFTAGLYGVTTWGDLFSPRQKLALHTVGQILRDYEAHLLKQATDPLLVRDVVTALALAVSNGLHYSTTMSTWLAEHMISCFITGNAIAMRWDWAEANPLCAEYVGGLDYALTQAEDALAAIKSLPRSATVMRADAAESPLPDDSTAMFFTDPPYYDVVPYADLSDLCYVWLRRFVGHLHLDLLSGQLTPKAEQIVVNPYAVADGRGDQSPERYQERMTKAFAEGRRVLKPDGIGCIVFAHKGTAAWEALLGAIIDAGFIVTASWPIDTERAARMRANKSAALGSSVHIVVRPRENANGLLCTDSVGDWRAVLRELPKRIHEWMPRLAKEGVVGADAIFACLGPALEIFSRYARVEKASGERVELREYLEQVWAAVAREALSMIFEDADATGLEEDARLTAMWLWTLSTSANGGNGTASAAADEEGDAASEDEDEEGTGKAKAGVGFSLEFDAARKIAQGLGAYLEDLGRVVEIKGDQARLLSVSERTRHLFGKDQAQRAPARRAKKVKQLTLFEELEAAEKDAGWGDVGLPPLGETTLDRVHQAMVLFAAGRGEALKRFLVEEGVGRTATFWKLAQSLSALYPAGTDEKRWVDGVLARKKGLGFG